MNSINTTNRSIFHSNTQNGLTQIIHAPMRVTYISVRRKDGERFFQINMKLSTDRFIELGKESQAKLIDETARLLLDSSIKAKLEKGDYASIEFEQDNGSNRLVKRLFYEKEILNLPSLSLNNPESIADHAVISSAPSLEDLGDYALQAEDYNFNKIMEGLTDLQACDALRKIDRIIRGYQMISNAERTRVIGVELLSVLNGKRGYSATISFKFAELNRFTDILTHDNNNYNPSPFDNYINASLIPLDCPYVAAQAPLAQTFESFLRMIAFGGTDKVVTLVMPKEIPEGKSGIENAKDKSFNWWRYIIFIPKGMDLGRGVNIRWESTHPPEADPVCEKEEIFKPEMAPEKPRLVVRVFRLTMPTPNGIEERRITQYHFQGWPDMGIPDSIIFGQLMEELNKNIDPNRPIVGHCSAGVGRLGMLIAVHSICRWIDKQLSLGIDIEKLSVPLELMILFMRLHRGGMIQNHKQLQGCLQLIKEHLVKRIKSQKIITAVNRDPHPESVQTTLTSIP